MDGWGDHGGDRVRSGDRWVLFVRGVLNFPILGIQPGGAVVHARMFGYASGAALVALLATAGMHILLLTAPRPWWYFGWIAGGRGGLRA